MTKPLGSLLRLRDKSSSPSPGIESGSKVRCDTEDICQAYSSNDVITVRHLTHEVCLRIATSPGVNGRHCKTAIDVRATYPPKSAKF